MPDMPRASKTGITFAVADVVKATELLPEVPYAEALATGLHMRDSTGLEAYSRDTKNLINPCPDKNQEPVHPFILAANHAYDQHRPLVLSPDMIWLLIAEGVALHVRTNSEALRDRLVGHQGKAAITVRRDDFVRGFAGNDWEDVLTEFSESIRQSIGDTAHRLIVQRFSTTGRVEQAAFAVTLMDAFQNYFNCNLLTACGIPEITLEGTPDDWQEVRGGVAAFADGYELDWWAAHLLPVLDQFLAASQGNVDLGFWRNFYKIEHQSGGPYINGYVVNFFPYFVIAKPSPSVIEYQTRWYQKQGLSPEEIQAKLNAYGFFSNPKAFRNKYLGWQPPRTDRPMMEGMETAELPPALSSVPFVWEHHNAKLPMEFIAGFVGVAQNAETLALRPEIGWAVRPRLVATPSNEIG